MPQLMLINGERVPSVSGETFEVQDPATEEVIDHAPMGNEDDARAAIAAANQAFKSWRKTTAHDKAELLHEVARKIRERTEELATLLTREGGKPLIENRDEMGWSAACFDYYAELQRNTRGRVIPSVEPSQLAMVLKEPYGVVAAIVPWNYPILLMAWKVAPALAAGNTVIIKPSEMTPLTTLLFAEIFDHLPPGVVNIVTGYGATVGRELVVSPHTQLIAFTGSFATGREIARLAAERVKKTHLELGGKDAFIVAEDADLDVAVPGVAWAALLNAGQVCTSTERVYVHESIAEALHRPAGRLRADAAARPRPGADHRHRPADRRPLPRQGRGPCRGGAREGRAHPDRRPAPAAVRARLLLRADRADRRRSLVPDHARGDLWAGDPDHELPQLRRGDRAGER